MGDAIFTRCITSPSVLTIGKGGTGGNNEKSARTNLGVMTETLLYSNSSGTISTITLSDNYKNYTYVEVFFHDNGVCNSVKLRTTRGQVQLTNDYVSSTTNPSSLYTHTALLTFTDNTATFIRQAVFTVTTSDNASIDRTASNSVKVVRIVGLSY